MARICVDDDDFDVDGNGVLHLSAKVGSQQILDFVTPGQFQFDPASFPGLKSVRVVCVGGGGGGAGADAEPGEVIVRAGASGGGYSESVFAAADLVGIQAINVGAGGPGSGNNDGGSPGQPSSFGGTLVVAPGGNQSSGTQPSGSAPGGVTGTNGPVAGTGQIKFGGGAGHPAVRLNGVSGISGSGGNAGGGMGTGGYGRASEGVATGTRGNGGGGAGAFSNGTEQIGGAGGSGAVYLYLQF